MDDLPNSWDNVQIEYITKLINTLGIHHFVETGTYHGQTSLYWYNRRLRVHTVETNRAYFEIALKNFTGLDIESHYGDSRDYIRWIVNRKYDDALYYLDAHWDGISPIGDELDIIIKQPKFLVLAHDTPIPDNGNFKSDSSVSEIWNKYLEADPFPIGTTIIYPKYNTPNSNPPGFLCGYCIISKGYPLILDDRFVFMEKTVKQ